MSSAPLRQQRIFEPRARLIRTLGEELIGSETIAVIELVKNAYDADASFALVRFTGPLTKGAGVVEILDDGHGIDLPTLEKGWLEPATPLKAQRPEGRSESGRRRMLGEKGVGRFAAAKLATTLHLVSRRAESVTEVALDVNWSLFDQPDRYLRDVPLSLEQRPVNGFIPAEVRASVVKWLGESTTILHGTFLCMSGLREDWNAQKLERLRQGLSRLIRPLQPDNPFEVILELPDDFKHLAGLISYPRILDKPKYKIEGSIARDGTFTFRLTLPDGAEQRKQGRFSVRPGGDNRLDAIIVDSALTDDSGLRQPTCGPLDLEVRAWDREEKDLKPLAQALALKVRDVRADLDKFAGVNLYRDGFRVHPYGDPGDDWLEVDRRRIQNPSLRLSNNQVYGFVLLAADRNPDLRDRTNREGLVETPAFFDLQAVLRAALQILEEARYDIRAAARRAAPRPAGAMIDLPEAQRLAEFVHAHYPGDRRLIEMAGSVTAGVKRIEERVHDVLSRYRRLATLGQLIDKILHDCRTPLAKVRNEAHLGRREGQAVTEHGGDGVIRLVSRFELIDAQSGHLSNVFKQLEAFGGRKPGRPREVALEDLVNDVGRFFEPQIAELGVTFVPSTGRTVVHADPVELKQVLVNLIDNSLYWLATVPKERRSIAVTVERGDGREVVIEVADSGPGVREDVRESIFEPYFTTKPDGFGLGLTIAGEIIEDYYDGSLSLMSSRQGATFRVVLRRRI